jgi:Rrf2 family transcriptional regulator, cysteine metabolism repressor
MVVSMKTRYGFRFMINLGLRYGSGYTQIKTIAEKENISVKFLEHIASQLKISGLIRVERGAKGGYYLARKPSEISVKEIMENLEGSLILVECKENEIECNLNGKCGMTEFWEKLSCHISTYLESMTLNDLIDTCKKKDKEITYFI